MTENTEQAIVIKDLHFSIDQAEILKGINLTIKKGEFVGLIGPNGAGKTTLLKCINGIYKAAGTILINGINLNALKGKAIARNVALMHQDTSISFPFPCLDIVLMGRYPHLKRMQGESINDFKIARSYMEYTDTLKFEKKPVTQISGGERQRVVFAKALAQETEIILLDEPAASLDISHQEQIFKYCCELSAAGKTVVAAVHDLKIAARYCSKLVLMQEGKVISQGTPEEVLTSQNMSRAYCVNAIVYRDKITGQLDFYLYDGHESTKGIRVHVIGGGGSASGVIRLLFERGYKVSAGVLTHGDSDLECAEVFGIDYVPGEPFCEISDEAFAHNVDMVKNSQITVLCNMPFGKLNIRNLKAARYAKRLIIIEDDPPETRDYTGGEAIRLYGLLKKNAEVVSQARLHEVI